MDWIITLVILFLLAILPLGASAKFDTDGLLVKILAGPIRLKVYPTKKKDKSPKKEKRPKGKSIEIEKKTQPSTAPDDARPKEEKKKGGSLTGFLPLAQVALDFLGDFRRKLRVDRLELKLIMAAEDPCDLAVDYGRTWAAMGNLFPLLEHCFVIKKRDVEVECDFTADETKIWVRLDISITLGRLLVLLARYGIRALAEFLKISKSRKGGAVK